MVVIIPIMKNSSHFLYEFSKKFYTCSELFQITPVDLFLGLMR